MIDASAPIMSSQSVPATPAAASTDDDFGFDALIDTINPLQHIPIVSTLYRELTGDKMGAPADIVGGALYGGVFGFFSAVGNEFFKAMTGQDVGETILSALQGDADNTTVVASSSDPYRANRAYQTAQSLTPASAQ